MRLLDRYIARQVFVSAMYAVAVIIIILVLGNVFKEILRELAKRPDFSLIYVFKFIGLVIPISLSIALPFSFLTAILLTFGRLSADSEFVSMRMAGLSMGRICIPVAVIALFFSAICAVVNLSVTPWAKMEMEGMKGSMMNLVKRDPMFPFLDQQVMDDLPDHLIFARKEDGMLKGFQMVRMENGEAQALVVAKEAEVSVDLDAETPELVLDMHEVNLMIRGQEGDFFDSSQPVFMEQAASGVSLQKFKDNSDEVADQPENIGLVKLLGKIGDRDLEAEARATYRTELSMRLAFSMSCITFGLIGVPLGITAQRRESTAGFVLSLVIAVTYYTMLMFAQMQREQEQLYPHVLVWIPNILFVALGGWMFWRLSRR